jgi:hypothetical protein
MMFAMQAGTVSATRFVPDFSEAQKGARKFQKQEIGDCDPRTEARKGEAPAFDSTKRFRPSQAADRRFSR